LQQLDKLFEKTQADVTTIANNFITKAMNLLKRPVPNDNLVKELKARAQYVTNKMDNTVQNELIDKIEAYGNEELPITVPLGLIYTGL